MPIRCTSTGSGTLPLRKPGILTLPGQVGCRVLHGVLHSIAGDLDGDPDFAVTELFDLRLHRAAIRADAWGATLLQMRLFVLARHAETTLNHQNRINGDPLVPADLTESGRTQAQLLGQEVSALPIALYVHTRFGRTRVTAELALEGRNIAGSRSRCSTTSTSASSRAGRSTSTARGSAPTPVLIRFPAGSRSMTPRDGMPEAFRKLLERSEQVIFVVTHEIPIRYALNAAAGSEDLDAPAHAIPNARPYLFDDSSLERAASGIEASARLS